MYCPRPQLIRPVRAGLVLPARRPARAHLVVRATGEEPPKQGGEEDIADGRRRKLDELKSSLKKMASAGERGWLRRHRRSSCFGCARVLQTGRLHVHMCPAVTCLRQNIARHDGIAASATFASSSFRAPWSRRGRRSRTVSREVAAQAPTQAPTTRWHTCPTQAPAQLELQQLHSLHELVMIGATGQTSLPISHPCRTLTSPPVH